MSNQNQVATVNAQHQTQPSIYSSEEAYNRAYTMAKQLCTSSMVPKDYQNNIPNTMVAMEMAYRTGSSPLMVMQNMNVIQGRPSWSSAFIIAMINSCGRFTPLLFKYQDHGMKVVSYVESIGYGQNRQKTNKTIEVRNHSCIAYAHNAKGELVEGPAISVETAVQEGWYTKNDSKWPTMTKLMLSYRAAAFFGRLYTPDILQGMHAEEEVYDAHGKTTQSTNSDAAVSILNDKLSSEQQPHFENAHIIDEEIK
jgi:hypothetical protein